MAVRLSDDLVLELERVGDQPLRVENPRNHKLYLIIEEERFRSSQDPSGHNEAAGISSTGDWTEEKNVRRFALIDKEIAGTISADESAELHGLQQEMDDFLRRVAPLPLAAARDLHEQLCRSLGTSPGPEA